MEGTKLSLPPTRRSPVAIVGLVTVLLVGAGLRLIWVQDIEYKQDEAWTFLATQAVGKDIPFPWVGMPTSIGPANPGMSLWVFLGLAKGFHLEDPPALARAVQILSLLALALFIWFAFHWVSREEREPWLWMAGLMAINPLAILFQRKIWPPSVLPIFVCLMLMCWWRRQRFWGAFGWGLVGLVMAQIHLSGFFFLAGYAGWALLYERRSVAWKGWLAGSLVGALPLIPWVIYLNAEWGQQPPKHHSFRHIAEGKFWIRWTCEPLGIGLDYALGKDFGDFLKSPRLHGRSTYLVGALHALVLAIGLGLIVRACCEFWKRRNSPGIQVSGRQSPTAFTQNAAFWGFGLLLSLSTLPIHRHYMIIAYPLEFLWLARLALPAVAADHVSLWRGRMALATLCLAQIVISVSFLSYVHAKQNIHGDYGATYGSGLNRWAPR